MYEPVIAVLRRVAFLLENKKPISMSKALRQATDEFERLIQDERRLQKKGIKFSDITEDFLKKYEA